VFLLVQYRPTENDQTYAAKRACTTPLRAEATCHSFPINNFRLLLLMASLLLFRGCDVEP